MQVSFARVEPSLDVLQILLLPLLKVVECVNQVNSAQLDHQQPLNAQLVCIVRIMLGHRQAQSVMEDMCVGLVKP
jgi:hypothetical protein